MNRPVMSSSRVIVSGSIRMVTLRHSAWEAHLGVPATAGVAPAVIRASVRATLATNDRMTSAERPRGLGDGVLLSGLSQHVGQVVSLGDGVLQFLHRLRCALLPQQRVDRGPGP